MKHGIDELTFGWWLTDGFFGRGSSFIRCNWIEKCHLMLYLGGRRWRGACCPGPAVNSRAPEGDGPFWTSVLIHSYSLHCQCDRFGGVFGSRWWVAVPMISVAVRLRDTWLTLEASRTLSLPVTSSPFQFISVHSSPCKSTPVHSSSFQTISDHSSPFQFISVHSRPFMSIPDHSSPLQSTPVHSSPFQFISVHSRPFQTIPVYYSSFQFISVHSRPFQTIPDHSSPLQSIPVYFSSFQTISDHSRPFQSIPVGSDNLPTHNLSCVCASIYCTQSLRLT